MENCVQRPRALHLLPRTSPREPDRVAHPTRPERREALLADARRARHSPPLLLRLLQELRQAGGWVRREGAPAGRVKARRQRRPLPRLRPVELRQVPHAQARGGLRVRPRHGQALRDGRHPAVPEVQRGDREERRVPPHELPVLR